MALPKLETPVYELEQPSTGETIKYRPFLVKEQKTLMMAQESGEETQIYSAMKDLVSSCTFGKVDAENSPVFDIEFLFLQIRAKSVGEVSQLSLLCPDDKTTYANVEVDLSEVMVQVDKGHNPKIELTDEMGLVMRYPSIDSFATTGITEITAENMIDVIASCILQIYEKNGEKTYDPKDQTKKELTEFIEQLNTKQFKDVQKFFETMPKLKHEITVKNPKTKKENKVTLTGLNDFFG